jgi:hypothetical protein
MWHDLLVALALMLVIEGMLPFASPAVMRRALIEFSRMSDFAFRVTGLVSMAAGILLLYMVR